MFAILYLLYVKNTSSNGHKIFSSKKNISLCSKQVRNASKFDEKKNTPKMFGRFIIDSMSRCVSSEAAEHATILLLKHI